ncbi:MAG: MBL fold metallo-hydrolase, partial [Acidobacteria bacterium]
MRRWPIVLAATLLSFADARTQTPSRTALDVFFIDVEGGQATLFATPAGESMLVDAGWAGFEGRDAGRIEAAAKQAGVSRLDYLLVTHYHADHVGGVPEIARRLPVRTFVDHGATVEQGERPAALFNAYVDATASSKRLQVKPGDTLPLSGVDVRVVSSGGDLLNRPLPGAGAPNPLCRDFKPLEEDKTENARSVGVVLTYGNFRMIDIGDLTWNKEHDLVCPNNLLGNVDLYLTTHHGLDISGSP